MAFKKPKPIFEQTPDPSPTAGNDGQLNAVLKNGIETLSRNRPDVTQILSGARSTKANL